MTDKTQIESVLRILEAYPNERLAVKNLLTELDAAKQENERLRQIRYNATEAHLNIQTGLVEQIETLQQRLKQMEEALEEIKERSSPSHWYTRDFYKIATRTLSSSEEKQRMVNQYDR